MTHQNKNGNRKLANQKTKGILKKGKEEGADKDTTEKKSIKWDEMNVTATLHPVGKDYGHMEINEPPTPYARGSRSTTVDSQGVNPEDLTSRLEQLQKKECGRPSSTSTYSDSDNEGLSSEERRRREKFRKKRKEHYNEFKIAKKKLSELRNSEDEQ